MITWIVIIALVVVIVLWVISVQNRLVKVDELCNNSLKQIQVQQMSRYDALKTIVSLARESAQVEGETFEKIFLPVHPSGHLLYPRGQKCVPALQDGRFGEVQAKHVHIEPEVQREKQHAACYNDQYLPNAVRRAVPNLE